MLRRVAWVCAFVLFAALPGGAHGDGEPETIHGEVLDLACYVAHEAKGEEHAGCAKRCVEGGQPMGLLTEDGTVYVLFASHSSGEAYEKAKTFAGQQVEITGEVSTRAGVKGLQVDAVNPL